MRKEDNEWSLGIQKEEDFTCYVININGENYSMSEHFAGLTHAILLLVDAINDKSVGV